MGIGVEGDFLISKPWTLEPEPFTVTEGNHCLMAGGNDIDTG
jgi:hypothetical protein